MRRKRRAYFTMRFVAVKTAGQQARAMLFSDTGLLVRQRRQLINALRGQLSEYGVIFADFNHRRNGHRITGAMVIVRWACRKAAQEGTWLHRMLRRKPRMLVAIALANKMARSIWAMLTKGRIIEVLWLLTL